MPRLSKSLTKAEIRKRANLTLALELNLTNPKPYSRVFPNSKKRGSWADLLQEANFLLLHFRARKNQERELFSWKYLKPFVRCLQCAASRIHRSLDPSSGKWSRRPIRPPAAGIGIPGTSSASNNKRQCIILVSLLAQGPSRV